MITCKYVGQTGNQLFIAAAAIATAIRNNDTFLSPHTTNSRGLWPFYLTHLPEYLGIPKARNVFKEPSFGWAGPIPYVPNTMLMGYFQAHQHFWDIKDEVLEILRPPHFNRDKIPYTSLHVRRGDYVQLAHKHPPITTGYISEAIKYLNPKKVLVFSDDIPWCRDNLKGSLFEFSEGRDTMGDLELMSRYENHIICNSTFSYWAAIFGGGETVAPTPETWFGPANAHLNSSNILPPEWVKFPLC